MDIGHTHQQLSLGSKGTHTGHMVSPQVHRLRYGTHVGAPLGKPEVASLGVNTLKQRSQNSRKTERGQAGLGCGQETSRLVSGTPQHQSELHSAGILERFWKELKDPQSLIID